MKVTADLGGFPVIPGMNVPVKPMHRVAKHLVAHTAEPLITAYTLDRLTDQPEVVQKLGALPATEIGQMVNRGVVAEQERVSREVLGLISRWLLAHHQRPSRTMSEPR